jgi:hypothetical protein
MIAPRKTMLAANIRCGALFTKDDSKIAVAISRENMKPRNIKSSCEASYFAPLALGR